MSCTTHFFDEQGSAIISAMLIVALVAIIISSILYQHQILINQIENHLAYNQSRIIADAGFEWSRIVLLEDAKLGNIDHLKEIWTTKIPATEFENGMVEGVILDQQAFCNLNNLIGVKDDQDETVRNFKSIINTFGGHGNIINALVDWIDKDYEVTPLGGAEDGFYLTQPIPYRSGNQALTEMGNLTRIAGFNQEIISSLSEYCVALPEPSAININTALPDVIKLSFPALSVADIESIIAQRNIRPFESVEGIMKLIGNDTKKLNKNRLSVGSNYFLVNTKVHFGKTTMHASALLRRDRQDLAKIIWKRYS